MSSPLPLLASLLVLSCFIALSLGTPTAVVQTTNGPVQGLVTAVGRSFKGIPYAAPPVGSLRWASPETPSKWTKVYNASTYTAGCPQVCGLAPYHCAEHSSEDCLHLNVYTPKPTSSLLPVIVWIHGGNYEFGTAMCGSFEASNFASEGEVIVVTLNYRIGILGFLYDGENFMGNYGFEDQQLAMKWVQANVKAFGGDPSRVTLAGQSAGGMSVTTHLASPSSKGLFHAAIIESNPYDVPFKTTKFAKKVADLFSIETGCKTKSCYMEMTAQDLVVKATAISKHVYLFHPLESFVPYTPVVDGNLLPIQPMDAFITGKYNQMPVLTGSLTEDGYLFVMVADKNSLNTAEYLAATTLFFGSKSVDVDVQYPPHLFSDNRPVLGQVATDYVFKCSSKYILNNMAKNGNDLFVYEFDHAWSFDGWGPHFPFCVGHVCHSSELPFLFNPPKKFYPYNFTPQEQDLSTTMISYWSNFAYSGNPSSGPHTGQVTWPAFNNSTAADSWMTLKAPASHVSQDDFKSTCDFWDGVGYVHGW
eukprot:TRINITY_DN9535_c0_g1_i1.p1 TRINITY_DN9535_c0_g1~~TRINITY_DN9535_c0_g1_i1.p1  ORF type:complete len:540 (+),score=106.52 TRINITY_DN9535_c0_g1_i1:27-1622(+)